MSTFTTLASDEQIAATTKALKQNGFNVHIVNSLEEAKSKALEMIPDGSRVFTATSMTLEETGIDAVVNKPPYVSMRDAYMQYYGQPDKAVEMKQIGAASDVSLGSVHAVTKDGKLLIASRTGSQIPNQAYGASKVILVVGAQKLVNDFNEGLQRIEEHVVPLEDQRAQKAYGTGTRFNKLLVLNSEDNPDRVHVIIVKQNIGY